MHILLIHQAFVSPMEPGGTRHYEFARHLIEKGHEVTVVASNLSYLTGKSTVRELRLVRKEILDGVQVLRAYTYSALHRSFIWRVISFFSFMLTSLIAAMRVKHIDLVMGTSPPMFQAASAWFVSVVRRRPFLLEIRDLWPEFAIGMGVLRNPILIYLSQWLERFLYASCGHLLVNSPAYRDYLINKGLPKDKISLIPNGVDPDMFRPDGDGKLIRREWDLDRRFLVTYSGALGLANDIPTVLRAAQRLRERSDIRFLLVGDGKERKNLEALARKKSLVNVLFIGSRPKSEMPEILAASDVCIAILQNIPMFRLTYPNKVFDYMAAARPTILAIDGVIRDIIEKAGGGIFVPPGDDEALAAAILRLYNDRSMARKMGMNARAYVSKHLNRNHQAAQFVNLVQNVAHKSRS